ncbi:hypothetical protein [Pseudomonas guariconensis]|uniref:hypothetical protein n=1 Tax=Pseudomonas guariconensis TaxID=1288410 RepID=UPI0018AB55A0|nr:hypothetical protein [Pseudomonas guariconensis]MBF8740013.1 hypothetical protein [Pseudomonas guariconensis]MBF8749284.1 hypothetical protein [Pseudomonas guariconensis]
MIRKLGIALNIALIGVLAYLISQKGMPDNGLEITLVVLLILTPVFNLIALSKHAAQPGKGLLSLYLERKALEEQKKIADLKK